MHAITRTFVLALNVAGCSTSAAEPTPAAPPEATASPATTDLEELHAFARLYGYVRYFHPSDEAAALDWDGFAIHGVQRITAARDRAELARMLEQLFAPVAPTLDVFAEGTAPRDPSLLFPEDTRGLELVAWQHLGYGFGDMVSAYTSVRTNREHLVPQGYDRRGLVVQQTDAPSARGQRVRVRAMARVDPAAPSARVFASIGIERSPDHAVDVHESLPSMETRWTEISVEADVPADAKTVTAGLSVAGQGAAWFDEVTMERRDADGWSPLPLDNSGFERHASRPRHWDSESSDFEYAVDDTAHEGERSLRIARKLTSARAVPFEEAPEPAELLTASLGSGLRAQLPLSLYSRDGHTLGASSRGGPRPLPELGSLPRSPEDPAVRVAAVVVTWNVFQHFYPYFDVIDTDWEAMLDRSLTDALDDQTPGDTERTLQRMVAGLEDGHGSAFSSLADDHGTVPARLGWVEDAVVVLAAAEGAPLRRGDVIERIDGEQVRPRLEREMALASGSPQWRRHRVLEHGALTRGAPGSTAHLELRRGEERVVVDVERREADVPPTWSHEPLAELPSGVWLIDLSRAEWAKIYAQIEQIAAAPGVVFDLRGYPNGTHPVLRHLMTEPETGDWMFVPQITRPDREHIDWQGHSWDLTPAPPHIEGKVAFVTGAGAISYAESVMGYVEGMQLGEIVGSTTAGANGNINPFTTPGGYVVVWTGMRVLKRDGTRHHAIGIPPTIAAEPTLAGLRAGRDEVLERAIAVVSGED